MLFLLLRRYKKNTNKEWKSGRLQQDRYPAKDWMRNQRCINTVHRQQWEWTSHSRAQLRSSENSRKVLHHHIAYRHLPSHSKVSMRFLQSPKALVLDLELHASVSHEATEGCQQWGFQLLGQPETRSCCLRRSVTWIIFKLKFWLPVSYFA